MGKRIIRPGEQFGRLSVITEDSLGINRTRRVQCRCECGVLSTVYLSNLINGKTISCGCHRKEVTKKRSTTHGMRHLGEYSIWLSMKQRCINPRDKHFSYYGGRGITVCDRWMKFDLFFADMGPRQDGTSIDRISNDGNYEPANCRWATEEQQCNNKRNCSSLTYAGETLTFSQWSRKTGIGRCAIAYRIKRGWSVEKALNAI